jgi:hypothetical protein
MENLTGRALMESRYGPLGTGAQYLAINGGIYSVAELLHCMGLNFDDSRAIDVLTITEGHYAIRYYDGQDQRIVGHEFDSSLRFLRELRAHIAEWIGDEAYFSFFSGH